MIDSTTPAKLVRHGKTRGGKYEIELTCYTQSNGTIRYRLEEFENRRSCATSVGILPKEAHYEFNRKVALAAYYSNIKYKEVSV